MYVPTVALCFGASMSAVAMTTTADGPTSLESGIGPLVSGFNEQSGRPQVLAILSPT